MTFLVILYLPLIGNVNNRLIWQSILKTSLFSLSHKPLLPTVFYPDFNILENGFSDNCGGGGALSDKPLPQQFSTQISMF